MFKIPPHKQTDPNKKPGQIIQKLSEYIEKVQQSENPDHFYKWINEPVYHVGEGRWMSRAELWDPLEVTAAQLGWEAAKRSKFTQVNALTAIAQAERAEPVGYMPPAALEKLKSGVGPIGVWPVKRSGDAPLYAAPVATITEDDLRAMLPNPDTGLGPHKWAHSSDQMLAFARAALEEARK